MSMNKDIKLYSYQENAIEAIVSDPSNTQLISMPTGTGKTITFLSAVKRLNKKCLILVHREELLEQTLEKAKVCGFKEEGISIVSSYKKDNLNYLSLAMVQSLAKNLERYDPSSIDMIVVDEAHHSTAPSYLKIFNHFRIFEDKKLLLGFTATPLRGDAKALGNIFHSHSFKMTLSEATQNGYICPVHGIKIDIQTSLEEIESQQGDYDLQQLDHIMNCDVINDEVVKRCENLKKVPAIVFCTSVNHAEILAKKLRQKKRKAVSVSYKTPKRILDRIYKMLKEGRIDFITNAVKLSEGFDYPPIQSIILVRPTRSPVLYKQMIGRGLRKSPNKHDCFVLEFSGSDPKMICWEDIDQNCTFKCCTADQIKSRETALNFYKSRFQNPNVKILDVRVSPFNFYECCIRRICKYNNHYFCPTERGFTLFEYVPVKTKGYAECYNLWVCEIFWDKEYESFYEWCEGGWLWFEAIGHEQKDLKPMLQYYTSHQNGGVGKWYPSEEEPMTAKQKLLLKNIPHSTMSARKAEMFIEESAIKKIISKYYSKRIYKAENYVCVRGTI